MLRRGVATSVTTTLVVACMLAVASPASAHWDSSGTGSAAATTGSLAPPTQVTAVSSEPAVADVSWTASTGTPEPEGYFVERSDVDGTYPACGSSAASLLTAVGCRDEGLLAGTYTYRVVAVFRSWSARSASSDPVVVATTLLGAAAPFSVLGTAVTTTGSTAVSGDLGTTPGTAVVGFPDGIVAGDIHAGDPTAAAAEVARAGAYADLAGRSHDYLLSGDLVGQVLVPGVYYAGAALGLTGILTFDGGGDPDAEFIIQVNAAVTTAAASSMILINGAQAANVYWVVNAAVTAGADSFYSGTIIAQGAIGLGANTQLIGRALSGDAVTMANNVVRFTDALPPVILVAGGSSAATKDTSPTISGTTTAAPGRTVTVSVGNQTLTTTVQVDQSWTVTAVELLAGDYPVVVKVRDAAGNGATATQNLRVEVSPPTIDLGLAQPFSLLAGTTITSTGVSHADGDVGVSPGTGNDLPESSVDGTTHNGDLTAANALEAFAAALADGSGRLPHTEFAGDLIGKTFHTGVHHSSTALALTGTLTLDAEGNPDAVFIIQVDAAMNTAASSAVVLAGGAQAANVFWVVDGAVTTGALTTLPGTILSTGTITLGAGTHLTGRALTGAAIVMAGTTISSPEQP